MHHALENPDDIKSGFKKCHIERERRKKEQIEEHEKQEKGEPEVNFALHGLQNFRVLTDEQMKYLLNARFKPREIKAKI